MGVTHIVLFQFKPGVSPEAIKQACDGVTGLKDNCIHPLTQKSYIKSFRGGIDNSPEGMQNGFTHIFVAEFESAEDRDYYVSRDPVHLGLGEEINGLVDRVQVVDYTSGVWE